MENDVSSRLKLTIVTGTRADYGHLRPLFFALQNEPRFAPELLVTGSHLHSQFSGDVSEIEQDGFPIGVKIPVEVTDDSSSAIARAMAAVMTGAADYFREASPGGVIVYGDRWEMLGVAIAASLARVPLVHIGGGDSTEAVYDEGFRHSISKLSHLHFTATELSRRRVVQLGENPAVVQNVGSLAIDALKSVKVLSRAEFSASTGFQFSSKNILITFHPETVRGDAKLEADELFAALRTLEKSIGILITLSGLDAQFAQVHDMMRGFARSRARTTVISSLGHARYVSALALFDVVVGNSSSGFYEAPSLGIPTVNIGERQRGREAAASVETVPAKQEAIASAVRAALSRARSSSVNPYGDGETAKRIVVSLKEWFATDRSLQKSFFLV